MYACTNIHSIELHPITSLYQETEQDCREKLSVSSIERQSELGAECV